MESNQCSPIEVTTHNLYFHEESPILSADSHGNLIATSGTDKTIRIWSAVFGSPTYSTNVYKTAANSSIKIEHVRDITGFYKAVNTVRFNRQTDSFLLAGCSDRGKIVAITDNNNKVIRAEDGDDAYDMCWGTDLTLFVAFLSGHIEVHKMTTIDDGDHDDEESERGREGENRKNATAESDTEKRFGLVFRMRVSEQPIQGISYNEKYRIVAVYSLDKCVTLLEWKENKLVLLNKITTEIDSSKALFRRLLCVDEKLFVFTKNNTMSLYVYPFTSDRLQMRFGPFDGGVTKVLMRERVLVVCTKRSVYFFVGKRCIFSVINVCFMTITDAFFLDNSLFIASTDGFLASIRLDLVRQYLGIE